MPKLTVRTFAISLLLVSLLGGGGAHALSDEAIRHNDRAVALLKEGQMEEAVAELQRALDRDPGYGTARLNLGYAYDRLDRIDEAMAEYRKVIELDPKNVLAHNNLGVLYDRQGRYDEAIAAFETVLQTDPGHAAALKNLENAKQNKNTFQERQERLVQARKEAEANPHDPAAAFILARLYAATGEKDQAVEWLARALALGLKEFPLLKDDPAFTDLRDDPRFRNLVEGR